MAKIDRDAGHPVVLAPAEPIEFPFDFTNKPIAQALAEYEGFAADVPHTTGLIQAVTGEIVPPDPQRPLDHPEVPTPANALRLQRMLRPGFLTGLSANTDFQLPTPDPAPANMMFERHGAHAGDDVDVVVPSSAGGTWAQIEMWSFEDKGNNGGASWPAPMIRVREGQLVHTHLGTGMGPHTIHHHGIEPTPMNDGVGHLTFEISGGGYAYQWLAAEAGTYFYHCHRNTVLHFERGMYGPLIIDPNVPGAPFQPTFWPRKTYVANDLVDYHAEALWVVDDLDTRWHGLRRANSGPDINYGTGPGRPDGPDQPRPLIENRAAGIQLMGPEKAGDPNNRFTTIDSATVDENGDNIQCPRLHDFDPNVFVVTGIPVPVNPTATREPGGPPWGPSIPRTVPSHVLNDMGVAVARGGKILVRTLNAAYCHTRWQFPSEIPGQVIAADGRTFGKAPFAQGYSTPMTLASMNHRFQLSVARRWDVLLDTATVAPGLYNVQVTVHASVGDATLVTILLPILVQ
jgi:FtsP/CotA-like multicopper oxidase with cupredoxin domain